MGARIIVLVLLLSSYGALCAQGRADAHMREGDRYFQQMAYARAASAYQVAAELGAVNEHVTKRLAECHMRLGNTAEAERWYATVVKFLNREPIDLYNYAEALKSNGRYQEAEEWMDRYNALQEPDGSPKRSNITGFARKFSEGDPRFGITAVGINTPFSDFGAAWLDGGQVIFTSARNEMVGIERRAAYNGQPFLDLYLAVRTLDGDLVSARPLDGSVNTKYHEGPATAGSRGDEIWFTRNIYQKGRAQKSRQGVSRLGIYRARKEGDTYGDVEPFLYNNSEVSNGHPSLAVDGRRLFFVSDMPGGYGGTDIYVCHWQDGQWGEPENLGARVNSAQDESFPFIAADGTLYFASNGHHGLGGLDVFASKPGPGGVFQAPINLGVPVNGPKDDFAFIIDPSGQRGYFSSDRPGGRGSDDIYAFTVLAPLEQRYLVTGTVIDEEYGIPVIACEVRLYDMEDRLLNTVWTDPQGQYSFAVDKDKAYRIMARLKGRYDAQQHVSTERIDEEQILTRDVHLVADAGIWLRGTVRYKDQLGFIPGMTVSVVNMSSFFSESRQTGDGGDFAFRLAANEEFEVMFELPGYFSQSVAVSTAGMKQGIIDLNELIDLAFEPIELGKPIPLRHIRWTEGSAGLDALARSELDALAERLLVNPGVYIEVVVHCDSRGDAAAGQRSTQRRAEAIAEHLRSKGVPRERIMAKGMGSSRLLNGCGPGVACTDEEHAVNQRSEYTVTAVKP